MSLMSPAERKVAEAIGKLGFCNPFLPERGELERAVLGPRYQPTETIWSLRGDRAEVNPNLILVAEEAERRAEALRAKIAGGAKPNRDEAPLYEELALFALYHRYRARLSEMIEDALAGKKGAERAGFYGKYARDMEALLGLAGLRTIGPEEAAHIFACFFQLRRAFHFTFRSIVGGTMATARLRAAVWQSIFTHDMRRYRRFLYRHMGDMTCLITGPSGTGKELVARAIGMSRYIPFDPEARTFGDDFTASFHPINLSAMAPTLIESELFGHQRGAYTGAVADRKGWLEMCPARGTVFLDEVGELDPAIQVKLLRVLQERTFQRLGDTATLKFEGKIIAATNRDLGEEIRAGRLREDFYYRLCSDTIETPALRGQLAESPGELRNLALFLCRREFGDEEAEPLAEEVCRWIEANLGPDYAWPGNVRELEQCMRNVVIRGEYRPVQVEARGAGPGGALAAALEKGELTAEQVLSRYCTLVYARTGSYQEAARRLGVDHRTVKSKIDGALLGELREGESDRGS